MGRASISVEQTASFPSFPREDYAKKKPPSQAARELEAGQAAFFLILALTAVALRFM